jgi:hypothetical protein
MDGAGQDVEHFLIDAINYDSTTVYEQYGEEEAQTANSFLNMSRDAIGEENDDDFAPRHEQTISSENPVGVHILCIYTYRNLIYILY